MGRHQHHSITLYTAPTNATLYNATATAAVACQQPGFHHAPGACLHDDNCRTSITPGDCLCRPYLPRQAAAAALVPADSHCTHSTAPRLSCSHQQESGQEEGPLMQQPAQVCDWPKWQHRTCGKPVCIMDAETMTKGINPCPTPSTGCCAVLQPASAPMGASLGATQLS